MTRESRSPCSTSKCKKVRINTIKLYDYAIIYFTCKMSTLGNCATDIFIRNYHHPERQYFTTISIFLCLSLARAARTESNKMFCFIKFIARRTFRDKDRKLQSLSFFPLANGKEFLAANYRNSAAEETIQERSREMAPNYRFRVVPPLLHWQSPKQQPNKLRNHFPAVKKPSVLFRRANFAKTATSSSRLSQHTAGQILACRCRNVNLLSLKLFLDVSGLTLRDSVRGRQTPGPPLWACS
jgi:hypothetical protein